jgi:3-dehydroquinate dehydratase-2
MTISVIHGVNLSRLGQREPEIYGSETLEDINKGLQSAFPKIDFQFAQSDIEGELVQAIWKAGKKSKGIILNPGAYTHTSVALRDAVAASDIPVIEVHLSNLHSREPFRHESLIAPICRGQIQGFGAGSYHLAAKALIDYVK